MNKRYCTVVVLAAGKGARMGTRIAEQHLEIGGRSVVVHALEVFQASPLIDEIILITDAQHAGYCSREMIPAYEPSRVSTVGTGRSERYEGMWKALCAVMDRGEKEDKGLQTDRKNSCILIHDGTCPPVTTGIIARAYEDVCRRDAYVVGMPIKDTIKRVDEKGSVANSPNRSLIWQAQTPQVFSVPSITKAFERRLREDCAYVTDDAMMVEAQMEVRVHMTNGSYENIGITTSKGLLVAGAILKKKR